MIVMANRNTDEMLKKSKEKSIKSFNKALDTIDSMIKNQEEINFSSVSKKSSLSRNYLYTNQNIKNLILEYRDKKNYRTQESKEVIINIQKKEIKDLKEKVRKLEKYREQYEKCKDENISLKKQLEVAYKWE